MSVLYLECKMGAAGDMLAASLYELLTEEAKKDFIHKMNSLNLSGVEYYPERVKKCGIEGTHMAVSIDGMQEHEHEHHHSHEHEHEHGHSHEHEHTHEHVHSYEHEHNHSHSHEHHHSSLGDIEHIVRGHMDISDKVKDDIMAVYSYIAKAESTIHAVPITDIHFHEVGSKDAIADIAAVCILIDMIAPQRIIASPINVGSGMVKCAHGILPVPAPATALLLEGIPIYSGRVESELCTPTGAALLKYFVSEFIDMPQLTIKKVGYGMGTKDFEVANCVRSILGDENASNVHANDVIQLSFNVDDMSGEQIGFAMETLLEEGALEVFTIPIGMKKSRPGVMICVILNAADRDKIRELIFKHTSTIGIRESSFERYTLSRRINKVDTKYGTVRKKQCEGFGISKSKYEYEDLARIARDNNMSINEVIEEIKKDE